MSTIFKYPIAVADFQVIQMPQDAQILTVQMQHEIPCLWARVDPLKPTTGRRIRVIGTGNPIDDTQPLHYIGTFQMHGGILVFHVFEVLK